jgi:hypothetical protein
LEAQQSEWLDLFAEALRQSAKPRTGVILIDEATERGPGVVLKDGACGGSMPRSQSRPRSRAASNWRRMRQQEERAMPIVGFGLVAAAAPLAGTAVVEPRIAGRRYPIASATCGKDLMANFGLLH